MHREEPGLCKTSRCHLYCEGDNFNSIRQRLLNGFRVCRMVKAGECKALCITPLDDKEKRGALPLLGFARQGAEML